MNRNNETQQHKYSFPKFCDPGYFHYLITALTLNQSTQSLVGGKRTGAVHQQCYWRGHISQVSKNLTFYGKLQRNATIK